MQTNHTLIEEYLKHGWSLVPIPTGRKGPSNTGWNLKGNALRSTSALPELTNVGLAHAYSSTMAFDIDDFGTASAELLKHGISLLDLCNAEDAVAIRSGRKGRGKLLYAMPFGLTLPTKQIHVDGKVSYELRCATSEGLTVQDVLPPSIHPDTGLPYEWVGNGHWSRLPMIPSSLLTVWKSLVDKDAAKSIAIEGELNVSWNDIVNAVNCVPADCPREDWRNIGMALHWTGKQLGQLDSAYKVWRDWSATANSKFPGDQALADQWRSFKDNKDVAIKTGTLFHIAKQHGYAPPPIDVSGFFLQSNELVSYEAFSEGFRPPAPDMNMDLWPEILATRAKEISDSVGCDPLVPLWAGISAVCGAVDARTRLELVPGFEVPPILWMMTIGNPADKKSPGSRPMLAPLKNIEMEDRPRYQKEKLEWEAKDAMHAKAKKSFLEFAATPEALLGGDAPHVPEAPKEPVSVKITVSDITSQKLVRSVAERPRGVLCYLDEMANWIQKVTDKTSGEDRSAWVSSYEGQHYEMDRVGAGSIHADNMAVSIYGNIQPDVIRNSLKAMGTDGLLQRFLPAILRSEMTKLGNPVPDSLTLSASWENTLRMTYALPARTYKLSDEARVAYREFQAWYEGQKRRERLINSGNLFMTSFGKLEGTAGRLALIFHLIENPFAAEVDVSVIYRVTEIIKSYIIPAFRYTYDVVGEASTSFLTWLINHVIQFADTQTITLNDIKRSARVQLADSNTWQQDQIVISAMKILEEYAWTARMDDGLQEYKHVAEWAINPELLIKFKTYREEVLALKQENLNHIYRFSTKGVPRVKGSE